MDGWFRNNYLACEELVKRCKEHGSDPEKTIKTLIDIATSDDCWHKKNATNFRYLLNHGRQIWNSARPTAADRAIDYSSRAASSIAERIARRRAQAEGGDGGDEFMPDDQGRHEGANAGPRGEGRGQ